MASITAAGLSIGKGGALRNGTGFVRTTCLGAQSKPKGISAKLARHSANEWRFSEISCLGRTSEKIGASCSHLSWYVRKQVSWVSDSLHGEHRGSGML